MEYLLQWFGQSQYQVSINDVPKSFYKGENPATTWTIFRNGASCVLRTSTQVVNCPKNSLWSTLELSGRADLVAKALQDAGILDSADAGYSETHSKDYRVDPKNKRVQLVVAQNGAKPVAAVELRSAAAAENPKAEDYPLLQLDQTFLAALASRFSFAGDMYTVRATSDFEVRRGHTRYTYILADRLDVSRGKTLLGSISRGEAKALGTKVSAPTAPKAITDLSALSANLSQEGNDFLNVLLATH